MGSAQGYATHEGVNGVRPRRSERPSAAEARLRNSALGKTAKVVANATEANAGHRPHRSGERFMHQQWSSVIS